MTVEGIVKKGKVVLRKPAAFAEGTRVSVRAVSRKTGKRVVRTQRKGETPGVMLVRLGRAARDLDLPADLSRNHDHYLYGVPKKK